MHKIGYLVSDGFQPMALATQSVFQYANYSNKGKFYEFSNYSFEGGIVESTMGLNIVTTKLSKDSEIDTLIVTGVDHPENLTISGTNFDLIKLHSLKARRIISICTGAFILAEAGILDNHTATTHWYYCESLQKKYPRINVNPDKIYVIDGSIWTSAGMSAGLDLALGVIERDLGIEIAQIIAHQMVMYHRRSGGQSQHSELLNLKPKTDRIEKAIDFIRKNHKSNLSVNKVAEAVNLSTRQFNRIFTSETGKSPARAIELIRMETAKIMVEAGNLTLDEIAREAGFSDRRHLREAFIRNLGVSPQSIRIQNKDIYLARLSDLN